MQSYFYFLLIIFFFKIINTFFEVVIFYDKILNITDSDTVIFWASIMDFMYKFSMGVLLLYIFGPAAINGKLCINDIYTLYLMKVFGIVLIINANWNLFFPKDLVISIIQKYILANLKTNLKNKKGLI